MFCVFSIVSKILDLISNIKIVLIRGNVMSFQERALVLISTFIVNIPDCCRFRGRVVGLIPFVALGSHTQKFGNRCSTRTFTRS
jgi:hypothetical protein